MPLMLRNCGKGFLPHGRKRTKSPNIKLSYRFISQSQWLGFIFCIVWQVKVFPFLNVTEPDSLVCRKKRFSCLQLSAMNDLLLQPENPSTPCHRLNTQRSVKVTHHFLK